MADILLCQAKSGKLTTKHLSIPRTSPVSKLIKEAATFSTAPADRLVLTYQGTTLDNYQLAPGGLVMVAVHVSNTKPVKNDPATIHRQNVQENVIPIYIHDPGGDKKRF